MSKAPTPPRLTIEQKEDGILLVRLAGDWVSGTGLPGFEPIKKELEAGNRVRALAFDCSEVGRWDSTLVAFFFKSYELCEKGRIDFHTDTLPPGVAKRSEERRVGKECRSGWAARH